MLTRPIESVWFEFESVMNPFDDSAAVGADTPGVDKADAYTEELTQA